MIAHSPRNLGRIAVIHHCRGADGTNRAGSKEPNEYPLNPIPDAKPTAKPDGFETIHLTSERKPARSLWLLWFCDLADSAAH
jgi:hypothetical protein